MSSLPSVQCPVAQKPSGVTRCITSADWRKPLLNFFMNLSESIFQAIEWPLRYLTTGAGYMHSCKCFYCHERKIGTTINVRKTSSFKQAFNPLSEAFFCLANSRFYPVITAMSSPTKILKLTDSMKSIQEVHFYLKQTHSTSKCSCVSVPDLFNRLQNMKKHRSHLGSLKPTKKKSESLLKKMEGLKYAGLRHITAIIQQILSKTVTYSSNSVQTTSR